MANIYGRQVVQPLTNKSGGGVVAGDVVIIDTSNDTAFTTTTSGGYGGSVGIAQETIGNNSTGRVLTAGYAALVNVPSSQTRGHFIKTHTVAKQATGASSRSAGSFGQLLTGGTTPTAWLWGMTDNAGAAGETVATSTIFDAKGDIPVGTGADTAQKQTVGTNDTVLTADSAQTTGVKWAVPLPSKATSDASGDTSTLTADTETDMPGCSISLAAGNWLIGGVATSSSGTAVYILGVITDNSNNHISMGRAVRATGTPVSIPIPVRLVSPGSTTTYKLRVQAGASSGTFLRYGTATTPSTAIWAIRVA